MSDLPAGQRLRLLSPAKILPNPENPRLVFRQEEMESLMRSIDRHGIQVPLTVYEDGGVYRLLDGERRWRCALKLNLQSVPTIVQAKPTELQNLVLMYNIHALREQWDYFTIASKLERVIFLYEQEKGERPGEIKLSELTGLTRGAIRRCQLLLDLPTRFKKMLESELGKPKSQQRLSEDFFIEMEKALKSVTKRIDEYRPHIDQIRDVLVQKFRKGTIPAVTDFRQLSKIAAAVSSVGVTQHAAKRALDKIFDPNQQSGIREAYSTTVEFEYVEKKAARYVALLSEFIDGVVKGPRRDELDGELLGELRELYRRIGRLLRI